jgi:phosphate transport system protein
VALNIAVPHTVRAFDEDLEEIRALIAQMGGLVEDALVKAVGALIEHDEPAAAAVVADDVRIDRLSDQVERHCVCLIALRAPMADDLHEILAAFKIGVIVERMGDCARAIAQQVPMVGGFKPRSAIKLLTALSDTAQASVRHALDAFVRADTAAAAMLPRSIEEAGYLQDELLRDLLETMADIPATITSSTCLLLAAQKLVRVGEHAVNLARLCDNARICAGASFSGGRIAL